MQIESKMHLTLSISEVHCLIECLITAYESNEMTQESDVFAASLLESLGVKTVEEDDKPSQETLQ